MLNTVIISTLTGSFVCLMLMAFKNSLLKLFGGKALYYISLIAMLTFLFPVNISKIPRLEAPKIKNEFSTITQGDIAEETNNLHTEAQHILETENFKPDEIQKSKIPPISKNKTPITLQEVLILIWLLGFIFTISRYFLSYHKFKKNICGFDTGEKIYGIRLIKSNIISSPMIFGFFKPTLVIPQIQMNEKDFELAIKHEMVHFKHHDSWIKLFAVIVNSFCWFNPITYFMVNMIGEICEYACDEQVTKEMDTKGKQQYSEMILTMICQASPALSSNMAKNKKQLKRRFELIMTKKKTNLLKTVLCSILMVTTLFSSIVVANEVSPILASAFKDDYVYITSYGKGAYNSFEPVQKNGEYYLPLRYFLNYCNVEDDKIKYDNGRITVDMWSNDLVFLEVNGEKPNKDIPGKLVWSTACTIGSKEVIIDNKKYTLNNAPYLEDGLTYIPYQYIELMRNYESTLEVPPIISPTANESTNVFLSTMLYGFDSMESKYYTDYLQFNGQRNFYPENLGKIKRSSVELKKTGYRTEFYAKTEFWDNDTANKNAEIEVMLNKVTRIYSKGSDIEGLFTVKMDGKTIYDNEVGYITNLPVPAGEGIADFRGTTIDVGDLTIQAHFFGWGNDAMEKYEQKNNKNSEISKLDDTKKLLIYPTDVKLDNHKITRTGKYNHLYYNKENNYSRIQLECDSYEDNGNNIDVYHLTQEADCETHFINENTFSSHFYFEKNYIRIDSFDAIITILPDNRFELKSTDGRYIIRATTAPFVPLWEWPPEERNAWPPKVNAISE